MAYSDWWPEIRKVATVGSIVDVEATTTVQVADVGVVVELEEYGMEVLKLIFLNRKDGQ